MKQKKLMGIVAILFLVAGMLFLFNLDEDVENIRNVSMEKVTSWKDVKLTDVRTGETFSISEFSGKPVLVESFAVWCPTCKEQQDEIRQLHNQVGDSIVSISLDTDPNEDKRRVLEHLDRHGYSWRYAVAPDELTQTLISEFGLSVVNAPSAPVVLVCEDQETRLLSTGVKSSQELQNEINGGC